MGSTGTNVVEVLGTLRHAIRDIKSDQNSNVTGSGPENWGPPGSSTKQLLLQIAALHKGFLALSDAFLENIEATRQQAATWEGGLEAVRHEMLARLEPAIALHEDLQQLATLEAGLQAQNVMLTDRVAALEEQATSLRAQLDAQGTEVAAAIQNAVTQAANSHFEDHLQHFQEERVGPLAEAALAQAAQQWAGRELAGLVQQEVQRQAAAAVAQERAAMQGAAELASQAAADVAALAREVRQLSVWCRQVDAAHANHEARLQRLEAAGCAAPAAGPGHTAAAGVAPLAGPPGRDSAGEEGGLHLQQAQQEEQLASLAGALEEQEARLSRLEEAVSARPGSAAAQQAAAPGAVHAPGSPPAAAAAAGAGGAAAADAPHAAVSSAAQEAAAAAAAAVAQSRVGALEAAQRQLEGQLGEAAAEAAALRGRVAELAAQQAQQGREAENMMHATLTDVMALARHTKALDGEVRALRTEVGQVQAALLTSSSTFARALSIPSPVGPFTSFPPQ